MFTIIIIIIIINGLSLEVILHDGMKMVGLVVTHLICFPTPTRPQVSRGNEDSIQTVVVCTQGTGISSHPFAFQGFGAGNFKSLFEAIELDQSDRGNL